MTRFRALPGVEDVHDLHIWSISSNSVSLTCHIRVSTFNPASWSHAHMLSFCYFLGEIHKMQRKTQAAKPQETLLEAHKVCRKMGIDHATIQVHDAADARFCYSETCDEVDEGSHAGSHGGSHGSTPRKKNCV
jgi:Co/Zn/Cd efflux system component